MKIIFSKRRMAPLAALSLVASLGALVSAPLVHAERSYVGTWNGIYPGSSSADNADCQLCHAASTDFLNPYGKAICSSNAGNISNRIQDVAVESVNSDADPTDSDNITEINSNTQPGWTPGNVNSTYNRGNCNATGNVEAPPTSIPGGLDPVAGNQPPIADANGPYSGTVNIPLTLDGSASSDPDGTIVGYSWDFGDGNTGTGATPTHTYLADGTFTVTLTVTDDVGDTGTASSSATIGLGNQPPVADANGPYSGTVGVAVTFDGTGSNDPDGTIDSYSWDFGDGSTGTGPSPTHTYATAGMFNVTLTVTDNTGASDSAGTSSEIVEQPVNQPPVADPNGPYSGTAGVAITFDGSGSNDPDGSIVDYSWDFGDGSTGSGETPTHTYSTDGNFTVTLTVTDDAGDTGTATTTASIGAGNLPPVSNPNGAYTGTVGVAITFDGSGSNDPDGTIVDYSWDFGDGTTGSGVMPTHAYSANGSYTVTLTVTDDAGDTGTDTTTATIGLGNLPPVADANGPYSSTFGVAVSFDGTGSSDPDGTIVSYEWDFGDGNTGSGPAPSHTYAADGIYHVTLQVTDDAGATDSAMTTATISPDEAPPVVDDADVFLTSLNAPNNVTSKMGRTKSREIKVKGDGVTIAQDATVSLSVVSPAGVTVVVHPAAMTKLVSPDNGATKYRFEADISCDAPGSYALEWTATISAAQNSDPGNDTLTDTTSVRCKMSKDDEHDDDDEKEDDDN